MITAKANLIREISPNDEMFLYDNPMRYAELEHYFIVGKSAINSIKTVLRLEKKDTNDAVAQSFRERLKDVAGFKYVPKPIPMRNSTGATVYYLFFASPNETGGRIVKEIFAKYKSRGLI